MTNVRGRSFLIGALLVLSGAAWTQQAAASFTDVPETRGDFSAIADLRARGIIEGRPDGSFGPDDLVNRAEAVTIVVRAVANVRNLPPLANCFPDVRGKEWYVRTVCYAQDLEWIGGYPDGTFQPSRTVSNIEFLKILLHAYGVDLGFLAGSNEPLAADAQDSSQWYFPYLAYAVSASMTYPDPSGNLRPGAPLARGHVALLMDRYLLYREGERNDALLGEANAGITRALDLLSLGNVPEAGFVAARARLHALGTKERLPEDAFVRATFTITEALLALVSAYHDGEQALPQAQDAYRMADAAMQISPEVATFADRIRMMAHDLAESIRSGE